MYLLFTSLIVLNILLVVLYSYVLSFMFNVVCSCNEHVYQVLLFEINVKECVVSAVAYIETNKGWIE